jgi:hypothetical protein
MNQNMLLIALVVGALFFMRRPTGRDWSGWRGVQPVEFPYTGGAGTGYGVDRWGDEG